MNVFQDVIDEFLPEVTDAAGGLLSDAAVASLGQVFLYASIMISDDTLEQMCVERIAQDNPFVRFDKNLCTKQQMRDAGCVIEAQIKSGEVVLPRMLDQVLRARFRLLADALSEMLDNIVKHKQEIADVLFDGQPFTCIKDITAGVGDYHNYARATAIVETDRGKMLYKPRNCLTDVRMAAFVRKYFADSVRIPKCYTDAASFGICEYLRPARISHDAVFAKSGDEDRAAQGCGRVREGARRWFCALGELTVLLQLLGSCDMHYENVIAADGLPAMIDLETILNPQIGRQDARTGFMGEIRYSLWQSGFLPRIINGVQLSAMLRPEWTDSSFYDHQEEFFAGFETAYRRCLDQKEELKKDVQEFFADVPVRKMIRSTQPYSDLMKGLYRQSVLASREAYDAFSKCLEGALLHGWTEEHRGRLCRSEAAAILRGDIPCFYTFGSSHELYDVDGRVGDLISESGLDHSLRRISRLSEPELRFEKQLIREAVACIALRTEEDGAPALPECTGEVISADLALQEAERIIRKICSRMIHAPNGTAGWIDCEGAEGDSQILGSGMYTGVAGIGVFAAAFRAAAGADESAKGNALVSEEALEAAWTCEQTAICNLRRIIESLADRKDEGAIPAPGLGEASGMAGILRCLCLINRYSGCDRYRELLEKGLDILEMVDISAVTEADRIGGLAGIISVLCHFPELFSSKRGMDLTGAFADRLLELKQFEADGWKLWETASKRHIISGAGHGMAGIAEALNAAGVLCGRAEYLEAALDAWQYEVQTYSEKMGTWPDNRSWPAQTYMHGYCSGAPGIGIMVHRAQNQLSKISEESGKREGMAAPTIRTIQNVLDALAKRADQAVRQLPLRYRDHLCCGNSAAAEYWLSLGSKEEAGRILNAMYLRKENTGAYQIMPPGYQNKDRLSLFYGITGIGYEMLRYACPDRIHSLLLP